MENNIAYRQWVARTALREVNAIINTMELMTTIAREGAENDALTDSIANLSDTVSSVTHLCNLLNTEGEVQCG